MTPMTTGLTVAQLPLSQYLHKVSAAFRLPRHQALCIYKHKLVAVDTVVLTPTQGFKLEAVQDDIGEHTIWLFYNQPHYFIWLGPTACLIPIVQLRKVFGEADDNDEVKLAQWRKSRPKLQRCKQAADNCECDPLAQGQTTTTGQAATATLTPTTPVAPTSILEADNKDTGYMDVSTSSSSPSASMSPESCDTQFCLECSTCVSCGAVGVVHIRGCHVWALKCGDTSDMFPAFSCDMFMSKKPCPGCDLYAIRHVADSFIL